MILTNNKHNKPLIIHSRPLRSTWNHPAVISLSSRLCVWSRYLLLVPHSHVPHAVKETASHGWDRNPSRGTENSARSPGDRGLLPTLVAGMRECLTAHNSHPLHGVYKSAQMGGLMPAASEGSSAEPQLRSGCQRSVWWHCRPAGALD